MEDIHTAHIVVINKLKIDTEFVENEEVKERLIAMINIIHDSSEDWPIDKLGRWVGFIQGVLYKEGLLNIDEERERTRPIFHKAYDKKPVSVDVTERK